MAVETWQWVDRLEWGSFGRGEHGRTTGQRHEIVAQGAGLQVIDR